MGACKTNCCSRSSHYRKDYVPLPPVLYVDPIVGVPIKSPKVPPSPGDVLLGYELRQPKLGYNHSFTTTGWIATGVLLAFAWPLFWIPAVMRSMHDAYQRPVYGQPGQETFKLVSGYPVEPTPGPASVVVAKAYVAEEAGHYPAVASPTTPACAPPKV